MMMKESYEKCPSCKGRVRFLWSSPKLVSQLRSAPSRYDASNRVPQNPKSSKAPGDTNSAQDICIPAIYAKVVTLDLNLSIQNKQTNQSKCHTLTGLSGSFGSISLSRSRVSCRRAPKPGAKLEKHKMKKQFREW